MKNQLLFGAIAAGIATFGINVPKVQALDLVTNCNFEANITTGCSGSVGGATFTAIDPTDSSGTGVFEPFLRLQASGNATEESGFNTDANGVLDNKAGIWTRDVDFTSLSFNSDGSLDLYLDWNEPNSTRQDPSRPLLNLVDLEIYLSDTASIDNLDDLRTQTKIYDLGETVFLQDQNSGSGRSDLLVNLAKSLFEGKSGSNFYLYSKFESVGGGFEEWSYREGTPDPDPVPTPAAVLPILGGLFGAASRRKKGESTEA